MNIGKYVPTVATLIVAVVVLAGVAFPMIGNLSSETTTISNDGASWIRMAYITDQSDYSVEYTFGDNVSVAGQSGEWEDMILYADSQCTVCIVGDYIVKIVGDVAAVSDDPQTVTVSRSNGIVSIDGEPVSESTVSWAYVPVANGKYGSFGADTVPLHRDASNVAVVGGFAGVYAYNENVSMDLGFVMDADVTEEYINSVRWALESSIPVEETQPFHPVDPGSFDPGAFDPGSLTPIDIDPINPFDPNENQLMSVPTPTYTDGDWGYELSGTAARIVSYSGTGGGVITIPATVGGYSVYYVGSGQSGETVFPTTIQATGLTIPSSVYFIDKNAFKGCSGITGPLTISTSTDIYQEAFSGCSGLTGGLRIKSADNSSFYQCTGITSVELTGGTVGLNAFNGCTGLTKITFPNNANIQSSACAGCTNLTEIVFNGKVYALSGSSFKGCTSLTSVTVPQSTQTLGTGVFEGCTSLTNVTFSEGVTALSNELFKGCTALEEVNLPSTITSISGGNYGGGTFQGCTSLKKLDLKEGLVTIGQAAFKDCTGVIAPIVIPSTVTTIAAYSFQNVGAESLIVLSDAVPSSGDPYASFIGSNIKQVLNLSNNEWTTTSYGLNAEEVRTDIGATSYMAPVSISETTTREGPTFDLLAILPIVFVAGLLLTTAWLFIRK